MSEHPTGGLKGRTIAALEVIATVSPDLLAYQIELTRQGALRFAVDEIAADWCIQPDQLHDTVTHAIRGLDRLARRRKSWRDPCGGVDNPNVAAILAFAEARAARTAKRSLVPVCLKLRRALGAQRCRSRIVAFLAEPGPTRWRLDQQVHRPALSTMSRPRWEITVWGRAPLPHPLLTDFDHTAQAGPGRVRR